MALSWRQLSRLPILAVFPLCLFVVVAAAEIILKRAEASEVELRMLEGRLYFNNDSCLTITILSRLFSNAGFCMLRIGFPQAYDMSHLVSSEPNTEPLFALFYLARCILVNIQSSHGFYINL